MNISFTTKVIIFFLLFGGQLHAQVSQKDIDAVFTDFNSSNKPGAAVLVVKDNKIVYEKGYGLANLEYNIPVTKSTIFHVASLSKQFTVFAILLLEKEGKLSLDDDIRKYIPEVPDFGKKITLRNLANHSSGLRDQWDLLRMSGIRLDDVITQDHVMKLVQRQKELNFNPGERNLYSNTGFTLLAEVVEKVTGKSFSMYTKEEIFNPLGMENTQFYDDHHKIVPNRAYSYKKRNDNYIKSTLSYATVGPTSLFTTAEDFGKWALNFQNPVVGGQSIIDEMNKRTVLNSGNETGYAMGQFVGTYQGIDVIVHSGSDAGYKAYFARIPKHNLSIAVFGNVSTMSPINEVFAIANLYLKDKFPKLDEKKKKEIIVHDPSIFIKLRLRDLNKFVGDYWEVDEEYKRSIILKNDTLVYYRNDKSESKLVPIGKNRFKMIRDINDVDVIFLNNKLEGRKMMVKMNDRKPIEFVAYSDVNLSEYKGVYYSEELRTSYRLDVKEGALVAIHHRAKDIILKPINKNIFVAKKRALKQLKFQRNKRGVVIGFRVSNNRVKNLLFEKK